MQVRLDEAEAAALKGGKKVIQKLESRVSLNISVAKSLCLYWINVLVPFDVIRS